MRGVKDTQCGFKLMRRERLKRVFSVLQVDRFAFDAELLFVARRKGLVIAQVPVKWANSPETKVRFFRDSARMLVDLFRIRLNALLGSYDLP